VDSDVRAFLDALDPAQRALAQPLHELVLEAAPSLRAWVNTDRWLAGYLFHGTDAAGMVFGIGPTARSSVTFHAMPWYGSPELRARYDDALGGYVAGKSCLRFPAGTVLPLDALRSIVEATPRYLEIAAEALADRRR
jgi:hypothetical protein